MLRTLFVGAFLLLCTLPGLAQVPSPPPGPVSLPQALKLAQANFPQLRARQQQVTAADNRRRVIQTEALPQADAQLQGQFGTVNNIYGLFFPQSAVLPISGPAGTPAEYRGVFGSAGGLLFTWEPLSFGQRRARLGQAGAAVSEAQAGYDLALFQHQVHVVDVHLSQQYAEALIQAQAANLERAHVFYTSVRVLARSGLRPGVDTVLTQTEIAKAQIGLNNACEKAAVALLQLNALLGYPGPSVRIATPGLLTRPPAVSAPAPAAPAAAPAAHPLLAFSQAQVGVATAREQVARSAYAPRLNLFGSGFARGSGASLSGPADFNYGPGGLAFSRYNYAVGATLSFPLLSFPAVRYQTRAATAELSAQQQLLQDQQLQLDNACQVAQVRVQTAADNVPPAQQQLAAARRGYAQLQTRYQAGLTTLPEVYQALYEVNRAEADYATAVSQVWSAALSQAYAAGSLDDFLRFVPQP
ncbi:outer membrane efflux protein [Hymenobacter roseosalivarius DSM 11622]|uniref:Outer membrane efflux protein n=1 Tax=Hymenobacter roseosalivarius DSM 11622 TaxID=645990 RepID=A0A1W1VGM9_9BACT|nr:TolC family protein [Hymenobacter roseosalivarius]SMB92525.1 outer membrane efflux protein [Hymenobacter roseosalivarius DSM 11622]